MNKRFQQLAGIQPLYELKPGSLNEQYTYNWDDNFENSPCFACVTASNFSSEGGNSLPPSVWQLVGIENFQGPYDNSGYLGDGFTNVCYGTAAGNGWEPLNYTMGSTVLSDISVMYPGSGCALTASNFAGSGEVEESQMCYACSGSQYMNQSYPGVFVAASVDTLYGTSIEGSGGTYPEGYCGVGSIELSGNTYNVTFYTSTAAWTAASGSFFECEGADGVESQTGETGSIQIDNTNPDDYFEYPTEFCADPQVDFFMTQTPMCEQCQNNPIQNAAIQCCCCPGYDGLPQSAIDYFGVGQGGSFDGWGGPNQCDGTIVTSSINITPPVTGSDAQGMATMGTGLTGLDFMDKLKDRKDSKDRRDRRDPRRRRPTRESIKNTIRKILREIK